MSLSTQINVYPPDTTVVTVQTPPVVQLSIVEQLVQQIGGGDVDVLSGDGITVTESPADTFTVRVNFGSAGNTVCEGDDPRLSDARTPLAHTHAISDVTGLQDALDNIVLKKPARKATAGTITKGQVVYIVGSTGTHLTVELADADSEATAATTIGVAMGTITSTSENWILVQGFLDGLSNLPTASFANGAALWLSQTAGGWTTTRPTQPAHGVALGWVVSNSNGSAGRAYVKVINGQELEELHDVLITTPLTGHCLVYDAVTGLWKNQVLSSASLGANSVGTTEIKDGNVTFAKIQDVSSGTLVGRASLGTGDLELITPGSGLYLDPGSFELLLDAAPARAELGLATTDTVTFAGLVLQNGEAIRNTLNGSIDFIPFPAVGTECGIRFDMTLRSNAVSIGTVRAGGAVNDGRVQWDVPLQTDNNVNTIWGAWQWAGVQMATGSSIPATLSFGVTKYNGGPGNLNGNHVAALMSYSHMGLANRRPTTLFDDPQWFVYSADSTQANDYVRIWHDQTDGNIQAGNGDLKLAGANVLVNGNRIPTTTSGTAAPSGGVDGDVYYRYQ